MRPASDGQSSVLVATTDEATGWTLELADGRPVWWVRTAAGEWRSASHSAAIAANRWTHLAVAYNASAGSAQLFVNGAASPAVSVGAISAGPLFVVGGLAPHPFYGGQVDELRVSNRVRYSSSFTPPAAAFANDSATLALYSFNEGSGQTVADRSGNARTLTLGARGDADAADPAWASSDAPTR